MTRWEVKLIVRGSPIKHVVKSPDFDGAVAKASRAVAPWELSGDDWPEARAWLLREADRLGVRDKVEEVL